MTCEGRVIRPSLRLGGGLTDGNLRYPTTLLGQLIERLDDISLRMPGVDHATCKTLSDIAEAMENQFRI